MAPATATTTFSGIIAAAFARRHPNRVTRLVLFSVPINERDVEVLRGAGLDCDAILEGDTTSASSTCGPGLERRLTRGGRC